ncbi:MAG: hypothetical protein OCC49_18065 [Fibrobacterales bacterium]
MKCLLILLMVTVLVSAKNKVTYLSQDTKSEKEIDAEYESESNTGMSQIYHIIDQLKTSVGDIPPYIERIAIYQLKVKRDEFNSGMARFIRGHIEEVFMRSARKKMVTAPELSRVRILSTDSSFNMSSSLPTTDELWDLGEKLRIDGFLEGSITRTEEGDVMLSLKIFKHKTNEQVWSVNLVAGPNKVEDNYLDYEVNVKASFSYWPIEKFTQDARSFTEELTLYGYTFDFMISEATTVDRFFYMALYAGFGMYNPMSAKENDETFNKLSKKFPIDLGFEMTGIIVPKQNKDEGYWLGLTTGVKTLIFDNLWSVNAGFKSRLTPHFGIGAGANIWPINTTFEPSLLDGTSNYELKMEMVSYEGYLHYYF